MLCGGGVVVCGGGVVVCGGGVGFGGVYWCVGWSAQACVLCGIGLWWWFVVAILIVM